MANRKSLIGRNQRELLRGIRTVCLARQWTRVCSVGMITTGRDRVLITARLLGATGGTGRDTPPLRRSVFLRGSHRTGMAFGARHRRSGTVDSVTRDGVMAGVGIQLPDGQTITPAITRGPADRLELAEGDEVEAVSEASEMMVDEH